MAILCYEETPKSESRHRRGTSDKVWGLYQPHKALINREFSRLSFWTLLGMTTIGEKVDQC